MRTACYTLREPPYAAWLSVQLLSVDKGRENAGRRTQSTLDGLRCEMQFRRPRQFLTKLIKERRQQNEKVRVKKHRTYENTKSFFALKTSQKNYFLKYHFFKKTYYVKNNRR